MGGRRATSLVEVLGPKKTYPTLEKKLRSALSDQDPHAISGAAAALATKAFPPRDFESYLVHLVPFIKKQLAKPAPPKDVRRKVRREWSHIKKTHGIKVRRVINDAVVQAAENLLKAKR
jgi:hypothetical protein